MRNVDLVDQLRLQYRSTYWLRNRKWLWLMFFWLFEGRICNLYVLYCILFKLRDLAPDLVSLRIYSCNYPCMVGSRKYWPSKKKTIASSNTTQSSTSSMISCLWLSNITTVTRSVTFTNKNLDTYSGTLRYRLDGHFSHIPERGDNNVNCCQLCYWKNKERVRLQVMRCNSCEILLCIDCVKPFHEIADLNMLKT